MLSGKYVSAVSCSITIDYTGHSGSKALDLYAYRVSYNRYILFNECSIPFNPPVTGI